MTADAADKAHEKKTAETADGERLVEHSTYTQGDRDLREIQDAAEIERKSAEQAGYVAAPGVGDYHKTRLAAKHGNAALVSLGEGTADDPAAAVVDTVRQSAAVARQEAAQARKGAQQRGDAPRGRTSRTDVMTGGTGGLLPGGGEGSGKSASSSGTDTTDRGMDASVGDQPPSVGGKPQESDQDRPAEQPKPATSDAAKPGSTRSRTK